MLTSDFDYELPQELIAQEPPAERGASRMMVLHRADGRLEHRRVADLPDYLSADDLPLSGDRRDAHEFPSAAVDADHDGRGAGRARTDPGGLPRGGPRTLPFLQLRRLYADCVTGGRFIFASYTEVGQRRVRRGSRCGLQGWP